MKTPNQIMFEIAKSRYPNLKLPEYPDDFFDDIERIVKEISDKKRRLMLQSKNEITDESDNNSAS